MGLQNYIYTHNDLSTNVQSSFINTVPRSSHNYQQLSGYKTMLHTSGIKMDQLHRLILKDLRLTKEFKVKREHIL